MSLTNSESVSGIETLNVLSEVLHERTRQDAKWGEQNHSPVHYLSILMEEVGEAAMAVNDNDSENYREELIQVAAVAVAMVECVDRNEWRSPWDQ